ICSLNVSFSEALIIFPFLDSFSECLSTILRHILRMALKFLTAFLFFLLAASSPKFTSSSQWRLFSIPQWLLICALKASAEPECYGIDHGGGGEGSIFQFHFKEMFGFDVFVIDFTVVCLGPSAAGFPGAGVEVFQVGVIAHPAHELETGPADRIGERFLGKPCVGDNDAGQFQEFCPLVGE